MKDRRDKDKKYERSKKGLSNKKRYLSSKKGLSHLNKRKARQREDRVFDTFLSIESGKYKTLWDESEDTLFLDLRDRGHCYKDISKIMGRTIKSLEKRRTYLNKSSLNEK